MRRVLQTTVHSALAVLPNWTCPGVFECKMIFSSKCDEEEEEVEMSKVKPR